MARKLLITLAGALLAAAIGASPASAVTCDGLQAALDGSQAGDTITLDAGSVCADQTYELPSHGITLDGNGATFDGNGEGRLLEGHSVGATVIRNATFREGHASESDGGAIRLTGLSVPTIENARFLDNEADGQGGAVFVEVNPFTENDVNGTAPQLRISGSEFSSNESGGDGGALYAEVFAAPVVIEDSDFDGNRATGNGGGAALFVCGTIDVDGNSFTGNTAVGAPQQEGLTNGTLPGEALGGGLYLWGGPCAARVGTNGDGRPSIEQEDNLFEGNTADGSRTDGGGEWVFTDSLLSVGDVFHGNEATGEGAGGGLDVEAGVVTLANFVATANAVGDGAGGGLNVAADRSGTDLEVIHGTIAGNSAGAGSGINGNFSDNLTLHNSIVSGNAVRGFENLPPRTNGAAAGSRDVRYTLLCAGSAPAPGTGNLCADPKLADVAGGDAHQTAASPTRDKGLQTLSSFLESDYEGDDRTIDADGDGNSAPDMGADEAEASTPPVEQPQPQPQQPAPSGGVLGTQERSCVSRRSFRIRLRNRGQKVVKATVIVNGKRVKVLRGKRLTSRVNLKGLPKGRFTVRINLKLANGKTISGVRRYRTCTKARPGGVPRV